MSEHVIVTDEDQTRTITMRRPEKKNTLTQEMYLAMSDAIDSAQSDPAIRCLIITGRSGVFTAGNDIGDFLQAATAKDDVARPRNAVIFLQSLVNNKKPHRGGRRDRHRYRHHHGVSLRLRHRDNDGDIFI